jgi:hypothetical protein
MEYKTFNKDQFEQEFSKSAIYQRLANEYPTLCTEITDVPDLAYDSPYKMPRTVLQNQGIFVYSIFYYIDLLLEINPKIILDVGCGENFLKKYIPEIVGMDPVREAADIPEYFDDNFVSQHIGEYDCAMAVMSIGQVSLLEFKNRINQFGKIIKSGGRGFMAFSLGRLVNCTQPHEFAEIFDLSRPVTIFDYYCYIKKELEKLDYRIIAADVLPVFERHYYNCAGPDWPPIETYASRDFSSVSQLIREEILSIDEVHIRNIGLNDALDGNIKIVFEV